MATKGRGAPETAAPLADITLPDDQGNDVRLGDLWDDVPVVLVFLRHYG
jgi:peroxiredoxin